jgi:hypothetical protein
VAPRRHRETYAGPSANPYKIDLSSTIATGTISSPINSPKMSPRKRGEDKIETVNSNTASNGKEAMRKNVANELNLLSETNEADTLLSLNLFLESPEKLDFNLLNNNNNSFIAISPRGRGESRPLSPRSVSFARSVF